MLLEKVSEKKLRLLSEAFVNMLEKVEKILEKCESESSDIGEYKRKVREFIDKFKRITLIADYNGRIVMFKAYHECEEIYKELVDVMEDEYNIDKLKELVSKILEICGKVENKIWENAYEFKRSLYKAYYSTILTLILYVLLIVYVTKYVPYFNLIVLPSIISYILLFSSIRYRIIDTTYAILLVVFSMMLPLPYAAYVVVRYNVNSLALGCLVYLLLLYQMYCYTRRVFYMILPVHVYVKELPIPSHPNEVKRMYEILCEKYKNMYGDIGENLLEYEIETLRRKGYSKGRALEEIARRVGVSYEQSGEDKVQGDKTSYSQSS